MQWSAGVVRSRSEQSILLVAWERRRKRPAGAELAAWVRVSRLSLKFHAELLLDSKHNGDSNGYGYN